SFPKSARKNTRLDMSEDLRKLWLELATHVKDQLYVWHGLGEILNPTKVWVMVCDTSLVATNVTLWRVPRHALDELRRHGDVYFSRSDSEGSLAFCSSKRLTDVQSRWSGYDRELFGMVRGLSLIRALVISTYNHYGEEEREPPPHLYVFCDNTGALGRIMAMSTPPDS
ncbi:hypothetical protein FOL47_005777, partial [Perkinsus chesapeaki]